MLSIATQLAHQSGCHRWHSCPSDSGSYTCGDKGYPCKYPTYSSSANSYTTPTFVPTSKPIVAPSTPRPTTNPIINYEINDQVRDNGGSSSVNGTFALVGTVALASGILWVRDKLRK